MMIRRRVAALVSAALMLAIGAGVVIALVKATQSVEGREWLRQQAEAQLARRSLGRVHVGALSGSFLTDLTVDSLEIRDPDDSLFVASGPIRLTYDPRDIFDGRLIFRSVRIDRPFLAMRRDFSGKWTHRKIWPEDKRPKLPRPRSAFGRLVMLEKVRVRDGEFLLMLPWTPADSLKGAKRDSAIAAELAKPERETRRVGTRYTHSWRWRGLAMAMPAVRWAHPDSSGRRFTIARMDASESWPPFPFRGIRGDLQWRGDSAWLDLPHFDLAASTGSAKGKVVWGSDLPTRYDVRVVGDSVSMRDLAWISPSLPTTGGGRMVLDIRNQPRDLDVIDYIITELDVRSHRSRLLGRMTWGVGAPVTILKDVDLSAQPLDFELLERFNLEPFPYPWRGQFTGRMRARGGPLNRFQVDELATVFRDANVPGAIARGRARGELDVLFPALTVFRGLDVTLDAFDLRTGQFLNPEFPRVNGILSGRARLDSSWLDVRLGDADLTHQDGDAPPSRFRGVARVTWGEDFLSYDVQGAALPLSATSLARSYPTLPFRGDFRGPLRIKGTIADLAVNADLVGDGGRVETDLRLDADAPLYRATGRATFSGADPRLLFEDPSLPTGELAARLVVDAVGDSLADLRGAMQLSLDRSLLDGVRIFGGGARLRFGGGRLTVDTLHLQSAALEVQGAGAMGLSASVSDTLRWRVRVDSLGGLRRLLGGTMATDSLAGTVRLAGSAQGWVRDFGVRAALEGAALRVGERTVRELRGETTLLGFPQTPTGTLTLGADTVRVGGLGFERLALVAERRADGVTRAAAEGTGVGGTVARLVARLDRQAETTRVALDTAALLTRASRWSLERPTLLTFGGAGVSVDSLRLRSEQGGRLLLDGGTSRVGEQSLQLGARELLLGDVAELAQFTGRVEGAIVAMDVSLTGTRGAPRLQSSWQLRDALIAGLRFPTLSGSARLENERMALDLSLRQAATDVLRLDGELPMRLGMDGDGPRILREEPLRARIRGDSVGLRLFENLTKGIVGPLGHLSMDVTARGSWAAPRFDGGLFVRDGQLAPSTLGDIRWRGVQVELAFLGDSVAVRRAELRSGPSRESRASLTGWIGLRDPAEPRFDLAFTARDFESIALPQVGSATMSGDLRLAGGWRGSRLTGALTVDKGVLSIPDLYSKDVISLDDPEYFRVVDTTALLDRRILPDAPSSFVENLTVQSVPVTMGGDVWLRSSEANINLGGFVSITRGRVTRGRDIGRQQLALDGPLQTVRGTYRLNLGPVQRTFEVESGELRFYGDPDLNPTLNISALHTVRQYSQQNARPDVRVRVQLGGTLLSPTAALSSPDSLRVTNADLISYLVTGGPSYEIGGRNGDYTSTAARVLLSSFGSVLGGKAAGGLCDDAQLSTAGLEGYTGRFRDVGGNILAGTRFNCAKQVSERTFVRLDAGLCQVGQLVGQNAGATPLSFADAIGVKVDYRFRDGVTASVGVEPPTSAVMCTRDASARGFVPTPRQLGFDLFRSWRF